MAGSCADDGNTTVCSLVCRVWRSAMCLMLAEDLNSSVAARQILSLCKSSEANMIIRCVSNFIKTNKQKERNRGERLKENNNEAEYLHSRAMMGVLIPCCTMGITGEVTAEHDTTVPDQ